MAEASTSKIELPLKPSVETLQQQIDSGKEAVRLLQALADRTPTTSNVQGEVAALKELTEVRFRLEKERTDDLNEQRDRYEQRIADILAEQKNKDALLLSTQVDKLGVTTGERLSIIEKNQYTTGGQAAVRDPQLAETLATMAATLKGLATTGSETKGKSEGVSATWAAILSAVFAAAALAGVVGFIIARTN